MELSMNISKKKNKSKKIDRDTQNLSNMQGVNPGFSFNWDAGQKAPQGKVFAKKRKISDKTNVASTNIAAKPIGVASKIVHEKVNKKEIIKPVKTAENINLNTKKTTYSTSSESNVQNFNNDDSEHSKEHIKRKQKKDKILAKKLAQEGKQAEVKLPQNDQKNYSLFSQKHKKVYVDSSGGKSVSEKVFTGDLFKDFNIHVHLLSNLDKMGFKQLTNVQKKSIPVVIEGKNTLIRSQTGSGKTLTYAVPIINALQGLTPRLKRTDGIQAIIVVPTRELVLQTQEIFSKLNTFQWVVVSHLCGGENRKSEKDRIRKGINVLIGTPGRLLDHVLHTNAMKIDKVRCLVLDEADRLLDMGFRKDIVSLVEALDRSKSDSSYDPMAILKKKTFNTDEDTAEEVNSSETSPLMNINSNERQTLLLSATLTKGVTELAEFTMKDHVFIDAMDHTSNAILGSYIIPDTVRQEFIVTYVKHRLFTLSALLVSKTKDNSKIFVFMASTQMVEYHYDLFSKCLLKMPVNRGKFKIADVPILDEDESDDGDEEEIVLDTEIFKLHGSMDQKMRKEVFTAFRAASKGILICTDVVARGIDVPAADCIVQYTGPQTDDDYLHRVGRTGRAGKAGTAIIFLTHEEQEYVSHLREHRVFLKKRDPEEYLKSLCDIMEESDTEKAATSLQKRYETSVANDKDLYKVACFAYSTWSRFYNSYPTKMRSIFDFKKVNLGHYVTSFALRDTPTSIARIVRGQVTNVEAPRLNRKLANHKDNAEMMRPRRNNQKQKKPRSLSLVTSEFASGLEPAKKKKKTNKDN